MVSRNVTIYVKIACTKPYTGLFVRNWENLAILRVFVNFTKNDFRNCFSCTHNNNNNNSNNNNDNDNNINENYNNNEKLLHI